VDSDQHGRVTAGDRMDTRAFTDCQSINTRSDSDLDLRHCRALHGRDSSDHHRIGMIRLLQSTIDADDRQETQRRDARTFCAASAKAAKVCLWPMMRNAHQIRRP
jgi:hypothetical protein